MKGKKNEHLILNTAWLGKNERVLLSEMVGKCDL